MSAITRRIDALEGATTGGCACDGMARVVYVNDWRVPAPEPGLEMCPKCSRRRPTLTVRWLPEGAWRSSDEAN